MSNLHGSGCSPEYFTGKGYNSAHFKDVSFEISPSLCRKLIFSKHSPPHHKERLLPDGGIDLVIDLTQVPKNLYDNEDFEQFTSFKKSMDLGLSDGSLSPLTRDKIRA